MDRQVTTGDDAVELARVGLFELIHVGSRFSSRFWNDTEAGDGQAGEGIGYAFRVMRALLQRLFNFRAPPRPRSDIERARQLIAAIDAGGIPLDKTIVNRIAESFGLEVSRKARLEDTIARIRAALTRYGQG